MFRGLLGLGLGLIGFALVKLEIEESREKEQECLKRSQADLLQSEFSIPLESKSTTPCGPESSTQVLSGVPSQEEPISPTSEQEEADFDEGEPEEVPE